MSRHCSRLRSAAVVACLGAALLIVACDHSPTPRVTQPLPPPVIVKTPDEGVIQRSLPAPTLEAPPGPEAQLAGQAGIPPVPAGSARVALLLPLSGRLAEMGKAMLNAAQLALFEIADDRLQLIAYDTGDTAEAAEAKARKAVSDGASLVIGPLLATSTKAVAPIARGANIRVLSFSSDRRAGGEGVYVLGFSPETEVERVVSYAAETGARRFSLLAPKDSYGNTVAAALRKIAKDQALTIERIELYDPRTKEFGDILDRVRGTPPPPPSAPAALPPPPGVPGAPATPTTRGGGSALAPTSGAAAPATQRETPQTPPFDALLVADSGERLKLLVGQLSAKNIGPDRVRILGTGAWDEPAIRQDRAFAGAWFAAPEPPFREEFERSYRKTFGEAPPRLATLGYDATALAAVLVRERGRDGYADEWLTNPEGFFGRDGLFRLVPEGYADRRLAILQIGSDGVAVVSDAQRQFTGF
jgi:branched-chain amino acid transport system substrate-binding protein